MRLRSPAALALVIALSLGLAATALGACDAGDGGAGDGGADDAGGEREGSLPPPEVDAEAPCDPDADLMAKVEDASIGDGASSTGLCVACAKSRCDGAARTCAANCQCQRIVGDAIGCYLVTRKLGCVEELADYLVTKETRQQALQLLGCVQAECPEACAVDAGAGPEPPADAALD